MKKTAKKFKSINQKLVLMIILASTCITAVATLFNIYIDFKNEKEIQSLTLEQIERSSLNSITEAVWQLDDNQLLSNIKGIFDIHDVIALKIVDENNKVIFNKEKNVDSKIQKFKFVKEYKLDYFANDQVVHLGYIKVVVTNFHLYNRLSKKILFFFLTQGLKTFIISFIMLSIFSYYVSRHLNALVAHLLSQAEGDQKRLNPFFFKKEQTDYEDEFDVLSKNYNEFAQVINQRYEQQQTEYELILNSAGEGIFCLDLEGKISYINKAGAKLLKGTPAEFIGQSVSRFVKLDAININHKIIESMYEKGICDSRCPQSCEILFLRKDGTSVSVECTSTVIHGNDGSEKGSVIVYKDVTDKKEVQSQLIKSKELAEAALKTKARFLANMSHEIRTPLNGIIGFTDLLLDSNLGPVERENAQIIHDCGESLLVIINDILDYSRLEYGALKLSHLSIHLEQFLKSSMNIFKRDVANKRISLTWNIDKNVPSVIISDPDRIRQILINVVNNAIKFTHEGSVDVHVSSVKIEDKQYKLLFKIEDSGIGIPSDRLDTLFKRFTQADDSTTRKYGGTGLGLAICKSLVEVFEGEIWCNSQVGKGSKFYFTVLVDAMDKTEEKNGTSRVLASNAP